MSASFDEKDLAVSSVKPSLPHLAAEDDSGLVEQGSEVKIGFRTWVNVFAGACCPFIGYWLTIQTGFFYTTASNAVNAGSQGAWLPVGFAVINAALGALISQLAEIYGRKPVLLIGFTLAFIGTIVIATAQGGVALVVGSCLFSGVLGCQGVFFAIPSELMPREMRGLAQTILSGTGGLSSATVIITNGALISAYPENGWRYTYYLSAGLIVVALAVLTLLYNPAPLKNPSGLSKWQRTLREPDWVGTLLQTCFAVPFLVALTGGGSAHPWKSAATLVPLLIGIVFLFIFGYRKSTHQRFIQKEGVLHHEMFKSRNFSLAMLGCFTEGLVFLLYNGFYPQMVSTLWDSRVLWQAIRFFPLYVLFGAMSPLYGWYTKKRLEMRIPLITGWVFVLVGCILLGTAGRNSANVAIGAVVLAGAGFAAPFALLVSAAQLGVPARLIGLVTAQTAAIRAIGIALGTSIAVELNSSHLATALPSKVISAVTELGLSQSSATAVATALSASDVAAASTVDGMTSTILAAAQDAVIDAQLDSLHIPWFWGIAWCAVGIIQAFFLDAKFIRSCMTGIVERTVERKRDHTHDV